MISASTHETRLRLASVDASHFTPKKSTELEAFLHKLLEESFVRGDTSLRVNSRNTLLYIKKKKKRLAQGKNSKASYIANQSFQTHI
jgi:hypothetical protein